MSPFSHALHELRMRLEIRQADLAERVGYEQSYISALEVGLKGPPTPEFIERLTHALELTPADEGRLRSAAHASNRKLVIDPDTPQDVYWLLKDLRDELHRLTPGQVRTIREILGMRAALSEERFEPARRLKRRRREDLVM